MSSDPFYVKDSLSSQFDQEDKIRQQKRLEFMEQQRKDYLEYLKMKDNKRTGTPFKITEDIDYHRPIKKLDNQDANLCTNITKDNQYSRAGYQLNEWKISDKYEKNFDENYIRGKNRSGYNIINHQIYDVNELKNKKQKMNPSLREELEQYEKNIKNQFNNLNLNDNVNNINSNTPPKNLDNYPMNKDINNINDNRDRNAYMNYEKRQQYPYQGLNERIHNNEKYKNIDIPQQQYQRNNNPNEEKIYPKEQINIPEEKNYQQNQIRIDDDIEYKNYLEYIKRKELLEKEKEYEEYLRQKELQNIQQQQEKEKEKNKYIYNPSLNSNNQNLPNFHNFINTAEDYRNKQNSYIDQYAEKIEKQRRDLEYKKQQEQKILTKENMELYAQQQKNNINNNNTNNISQLPFDRFQEEKEEYYSNKKKNVSTYSNLTSMTTTNPSLKNDPNVKPYIDPEKAYESMIREEKMKKYRQELDEQIKNRPQETYGRINNDRRIEVPPDPCK